MTLRPKQKIFVEAYLTTWSGAEAARRAGYAHPDRQGYRLLRNIEIQEAVKQRMNEVAMDADEVLARLSEQARVSIADFVCEEVVDTATEIHGDGEIVKIPVYGVGLNWNAIQQRGHLVKSMKQSAAGPAIELHDAQAALLAMAKRHGLLVDKTEGRLDVVEMTLDEWRAKQAERQEQVGETLADFEDDSEGIDA